MFIQRKVREMIARRKAVRRKIEEKARKEIQKEEKELEKKYGKKKAREMSEKKLQEVILRLEREEEEKNLRLKQNQKRFLTNINHDQLIIVFRIKEAEKKRDEEPVDDSQVIDDAFGYLENEDDKDERRDPSAFKDLPQKKRRKSELLIGVPAAPKYNEDTSEYNFQKFAKTYFQGASKILIIMKSCMQMFQVKSLISIPED